MIIKQASQVISSIIEHEKKKIEEFNIKIKHAPTIGKQYEGITISALDHAIPIGLKLRVVSGFIKNSNNQLSGQIDCMVCFGDGELVPGTSDEYIYEIQNVIAVIEIKKNLFAKDLSDSHFHLLEVNALRCDFESIPKNHAEIIYSTFATATGKYISSREDAIALNDEFLEMIFHGLVAQFIMPLRIVIGYDGFSTEQSLRKKFVEFMSNNQGKNGFGPFSLPDLVICQNHCLTKLNGEPYSPNIENGFLEFYTSASDYNLKILTELIFSRLSRYINFNFSEDDEYEPLKYFLGARITRTEDKAGWEYVHHDFDPDIDQPAPQELKWEPIQISKEAYILFFILGQQQIQLDGAEIQQALVDNPNVLEELFATKLIAVKDNMIYLIRDNIQSVSSPTGEHYVAVDNHGYLQKWLFEHQSEKDV